MSAALEAWLNEKNTTKKGEWSKTNKFFRYETPMLSFLSGKFLSFQQLLAKSEPESIESFNFAYCIKCLKKRLQSCHDLSNARLATVPNSAPYLPTIINNLIKTIEDLDELLKPTKHNFKSQKSSTQIDENSDKIIQFLRISFQNLYKQLQEAKERCELIDAEKHFETFQNHERKNLSEISLTLNYIRNDLKTFEENYKSLKDYRVVIIK